MKEKNALSINAKLSKLLFIMTGIYTLTAFGFITYGTMCAFQNKENEKLIYQTDIAPLSSYFNSGTGTVNNPYIISTPQHFINLQKLTTFGCFDSNTYFQLGANIDFSTYTDENNAQIILDPIGTETNPFYSVFDGAGYKIIKPIINSYHHKDVGLFGYVASGGIIKNLPISEPKITSNKTTSPIINPLSLKVKSSQITTPTFSAESTSITISTRNISYTDSGNNTTNYKVYYNSTNKKILTDEGVLQTANIESTAEGAVHLEAIVKEFAVIDEKPVIVTYVVNRYKIVFAERVITNVVSLFDECTLSASNTEGTCNNPHHYHEQTSSVSKHYSDVTYLGLAVGHLDGEASYVGIYNGSLYAYNKTIISHSSIIGRYKDEELLNSLANDRYYENLIFHDIVEARSNLKNYTYAKYGSFNTSKGTQNVYSNASEFSTAFDKSDSDDVGIQIPNSFKLHGGFSVTDQISYSELSTNGEDLDESSAYALKYTSNLVAQNKITSYYSAGTNIFGTMIGGYNKRYVVDYNVDNGMSLWINQNDTDFMQMIQSFFESNDNIKINFKLSYNVSNNANAITNKSYVEARYGKRRAGDTPFGSSGVSAFSSEKFMTDDFVDSNNDGTADELYANSESEYYLNTNVSGTYYFPQNISTTIMRNEEIIFDNTSGNNKGTVATERDSLRLIRDNESTLPNNFLHSLSFSIITNAKSGTLLEGLFGSDKQYTPIYFIGFQNIESSTTPVEVNLFRIEFTISYADGNVSSSLPYVDFLYTCDDTLTYDPENGWSNWSTESETKIYFSLDESTMTSGVDAYVEVYYTRASSGFKRVTATYETTSESYKPQNTDGSVSATISSGTVN